MSNPLEAIKSACDIAVEALDIAENTIAAARKARPAPQVTLVKVASSTYERVATALYNTGVIPGTIEKIATDLQNASPAGMLTILEKLASKAVYADLTPSREGVLVPKPGHNKQNQRRGIAAAFDNAASEYDGYAAR